MIYTARLTLANYRTDGKIRWLMFYFVNTGVLNVYMTLVSSIHNTNASVSRRIVALVISISVSCSEPKHSML